MEEAYVDQRPKNWLPLLAVIGIFILISGGVFLWVKASQKLVSPIPPKPSFEVIFYTPSPLPASPTSTPSGTLVPRKKTVKPTATPVEEKPTPTKKPTVEPTVEPSATSSPSPT